MTSNDGQLGRGHPSSSLAAVGAVLYDDPMAKVFGLDSESSGTARWAGYYVGAVALMFGLGLSAHTIANFIESTNPRAAATLPQEIDVQQDLTPPPPPPPTAKPEEKPPEAPRPTPRDPPPPPAPAQAGKVLTREADPNEPVDLTGDTIVTGNADAYVGGATASNGTGKTAVHEAVQIDKPPSPHAPSPVDRSRPARLAGGSDWTDCGFPEEATALQIDDAFVTIQVEVKADGSKDVRVTSDPGHGFGRLARTCALGKTFDAALDRDGNPIGSTKAIRIHFFSR